MKIDDGGYVYPIVEKTQMGSGGPMITGYKGGITRRDWLAGLAMQGLISNSQIEEVTAGLDDPVSKTAEAAYQLADAMIAEGKKET